MRARMFAIVGTVLVVVGLLAMVFDGPMRLSQTTRTIILVTGVLCLVAFLFLDALERRKVP